MVVITTALAVFAAVRVQGESDSRIERERRAAEHGIFWALVASVSPKGREACAASSFACSDDRAELGLALLDARSVRSGLRGFAAILRYRIDAGLSEDYTCYVLAKGRKMISPLASLNPKELVAQCKGEVSRAAGSNREAFGGVTAEMICSSEAIIAEESKSFIAAIRKGKTCSPEDF